MKYKEPLEAVALVSKLPDLFCSKINLLFAYGVVASGIIVCSILFACYELLRVEQLAVGASSHFIWKE